MAAKKRDDDLQLPTESYNSEDELMSIELRCSMSPKTRMLYADGLGNASAFATKEDIWHRSVEFLFERLAVSWTINGVATTKQKELLTRFRVASREERAWIREVMRTHLAEWFPEMKAP